MTSTFHWSQYRSPVGTLYILTQGDVVRGLNLSGFPDLVSSLYSEEHSSQIKKSAKISWLNSILDDYFDGDLKAINTIKVEQPGGDFSQSAWKSMRKIRAGRVASYAELADMAGSSAAVRAAGSACAKNKIAIIIPCHRIVKTGGAIGNYGWGVNIKAELLRHEGVEY